MPYESMIYPAEHKGYISIQPWLLILYLENQSWPDWEVPRQGQKSQGDPEIGTGTHSNVQGLDYPVLIVHGILSMEKEALS